jgi:hypothetical protein
VKVEKYQFTAGLLVTQAGFERRNVATKATAKAVEAVTVETLSAFTTWRADVMRLRLGDI